MKIRTPRPKQTGQLIGVRLQPPDLEALDRWIAEYADGKTRPEAIRYLLRDALVGLGIIPFSEAGEGEH